MNSEITKVVNSFFQNWKEENFKYSIFNLQITPKLKKEPNIPEYLKMIFAYRKLQAFEIVKLNEISKVMADCYVKIKYNNLGNDYKRVIVVRLIKEIMYEVPSVEGQWKINLDSMLRERTLSVLNNV